MTRKQLFVHIGHYKTGTSAVQDYLSRNGDDLRVSGFYYPKCARPKRNPTNHGLLSLGLAGKYGLSPPSWYNADEDMEKAYSEFETEVAAISETNVIISSEEFVRFAYMEQSEAVLKDFASRLAAYDVKIVFFIREPLSLLTSWYNQVNKGPFGTRNFLTFFTRLNQNFLAQKQIRDRFAEYFGAQNIILRTYKHHGTDHIRDFLDAIGCDHVPIEDVGVHNKKLDQSTLEQSRLAKDRKHSYDEATVSTMKSLKTFKAKCKRINDAFDELADGSDQPIKSKMSASAVAEHYRDLVLPLIESKSLNPKEIDNLKKLAVSFEDTDLNLAYILMKIAQSGRPKGAFLNRKLAEYEATLAEISTPDVTSQ